MLYCGNLTLLSRARISYSFDSIWWLFKTIG